MIAKIDSEWCMWSQGVYKLKKNIKYASYVTDLVVNSVTMVRTILYIHEARKQPMNISTKTETFLVSNAIH